MKHFRGMILICVMVGFAVLVHAPEVVGQSVFPQKGVVTGVSTDPQYNGNLLILDLPSLSAPKIGFVSNGTEVTVEEEQLTFYRISSPKAGWVWSSFIKLSGEAPPDPNKGNGPRTPDQGLDAVKFTPAVPTAETLPTARLKKNETLVASWTRYFEDKIRGMKKP